MKIVADDKIPFLRGVFEPFAQVCYLSGKSISPADLVDADALIVRTRTRCDRALLKDSAVRFLATATIGCDHIDAEALQDLGISWSNAPGCNAASVKNYIASALAAMPLSLQGKCMGIIGAGHVGTLVAEAAAAFGMDVLLNDPPRAEAEGFEKFTDTETLLSRSDIVTMHVPLEYGGKYPTVKMADGAFFSKMRKGAWFFNSCRGEVIDKKAFLSAKRSGVIGGALMDVWPDEPDIDSELLDNVEFATAHIAGYSADGKANGTAAAVRFIAEKLGIKELKNWRPANIPPPVFDQTFSLAGISDADEAVRKAVLHVYDIRQDDARLRADPNSFEALRGGYWTRREFSAYSAADCGEAVGKRLRKLGFDVL